MKMWLVAILVVLTLVAVDITVRIGWDRIASVIGSLVERQRQATQVKSEPPTWGEPETQGRRPRKNVSAPQAPSPPPPDVTSPTEVVRQYYADLTRHDVEAARGKWKTPPPRLQDMVQQVDWYRVEDIRLLQGETSAAQVEIVVTGKRLNQHPERWGGTVDVEKMTDAWKIVTMHLTKQTPNVTTPRPTDAQTPALPPQPLPGALPSSGDPSTLQGNTDTGKSSRMTEGPRQPAAAPPNWPFKQIPFGQSRAKVLQQFAGAEITQDKSVVFDLGKYESITHDLSNGIYTDIGLDQFLYSESVAKYTISYKGWIDVQQIDLYFFRDNERVDGTLFLVTKHTHAPGSAREVFAGAQEAISRIVGTAPTTTNTRYTYYPGYAGGARVGKWETNAAIIYYAIRDTWNEGGYQNTWGFPIIAYIDREAWKRYVTTAGAAHARHKQEQSNKAGKSIERNF